MPRNLWQPQVHVGQLGRIGHARLSQNKATYLLEPPISDYCFISLPNKQKRSKSSFCMENFWVWRDIFTKFDIDYYPRQRYNLRRNCLDRTTIAHSSHRNWPVKIQIKIVLYPFRPQEIFLRRVYRFGVAAVNVFSWFCLQKLSSRV